MNNKGLKLALKYAFLSTQENFSALVQPEIKLTNKTNWFDKRSDSNGKLHNNPDYYR